MKKQYKILRATLQDVKDITTLVNKAYRGDSSRKGWTTEADLLGGIRTDESGIEEILKDENSILLKYIHEEISQNLTGKVTGCVHLQKSNEKLYLGMLTVDPGIQNQGIGKKLLQAADNIALENNFHSIYMTVISVRKELIEWYERYGYRKTGETKPFPMNDERFGLPKQLLEFIVLEKII